MARENYGKVSETSGGEMKEPIYRWECTLCGISDEAESPEMARLNIDLHVQLAHPSPRGPVRVQDEPGRDPSGNQDDRGPDA
jgi:hypothetical protein